MVASFMTSSEYGIAIAAMLNLSYADTFSIATKSVETVVEKPAVQDSGEAADSASGRLWEPGDRTAHVLYFWMGDDPKCRTRLGGILWYWVINIDRRYTSGPKFTRTGSDIGGKHRGISASRSFALL